MNKVYNTQDDFTRSFKNFLLNCMPNIRKTQVKIIPSVIFSMINAESFVASDIANHYKDSVFFTQRDSKIRRIHRLFNNKYFEPYILWEHIIKFVINNYQAKPQKIHVIIDHMFSHDNFTVLMFSMNKAYLYCFRLKRLLKFLFTTKKKVIKFGKP